MTEKQSHRFINEYRKTFGCESPHYVEYVIKRFHRWLDGSLNIQAPPRKYVALLYNAFVQDWFAEDFLNQLGKKNARHIMFHELVKPVELTNKAGAALDFNMAEFKKVHPKTYAMIHRDTEHRLNECPVETLDTKKREQLFTICLKNACQAWYVDHITKK